MDKPILCHVNLAKGYRGGERQTELSIHESLKSNKFNVVAVLRSKGQLANKLKNTPGINIIEVSSALGGHFSTPKNTKVIAHAHDGKSVYWAFLQSIIRKSPYLITRRVDHELNNRWLTKKAYQKANFVIAISSPIANYLQSHLKRDIPIIPDASDFESLLETEQTPTKKIKSFFMAGALVDSHKGQSTAIEAIRLTTNGESLDIYGDGPDKDELNEFILNLKLEKRVKIHPWNDDLQTLCRHHDAFIMASRHEGLGSVVIDIMRTGTPVISSNAGGLVDLVKDNETGLVFEKNSPISLFKKIIELQTNSHINEITNNALDFSKTLSPSYMQSEYEKIYSQLI